MLGGGGGGTSRDPRPRERREIWTQTPGPPVTRGSDGVRPLGMEDRHRLGSAFWVGTGTGR